MNQPVPMRCHFHGGFEPCMLRGTNLSLTITTWPRVLADFNFDCVIGPSRVPAKLMQAWGELVVKKKVSEGCRLKPTSRLIFFNLQKFALNQESCKTSRNPGKNQTLV